MYLRKFSALAYALLLMMFISAASLNVFAGNLKPEKFDAKAQGYTIENTLYADLYLNWMYNSNKNVDAYKVYISYSKTDDYNDFELLQTIDLPNDSIIQDKEDYWFAYLSNVNVKNQEIISLYITVVEEGYESQPSNISNCFIRGNQPIFKLDFTTTPGTTAKLNEEYVYKFDVQTDLENPVYEFELNTIKDGTNLPPGAKLDKENKTITFTPTKNGSYQFYLFARAYDAAGNMAENMQYWDVRVIECEKPSTISGTVKDEEGNSILYCYAVLYKLAGDDKDSNDFGKMEYISQITFENSEYSFSGLDKGTYYVSVFGYNGKNNMEYYPEWYNDAKQIEDATPIILECDDTATANFILEKAPVPNYYTVSGYIYDAETQEPIEWAQIDFMGVDTTYGQYVSYSAMTDADGYYEASLQDGLVYTAYAYVWRTPKDSTNFPNQSMYIPQYWEGKSDYSEADKIILTGNLENINFNLEKIPIPNYYDVSGYVYDAETKEPIEWAQVDFMAEDPVYGKYINYSAFTDSKGYYTANLPDGVSYTAVAYVGRYKKDNNYPNLDLYAPQYWNGKTDPVEADKIELTGDLNNINFNLSKIEIYDNTLGGYVKNENGDALQNVLLIAYIVDGTEDINNMYRGYLAMTNNNGYFEMKNLYPAEYVLLAVPAMNITYAPGFYKENDFATLTWEDATKITVGNNGTYGNYNVKLQLFEKVIGVGIVKGIVRAETGRVKSGTEFQGMNGLQGVQIHIVDLLGNRIKSTETDQTGKYEFSGLAKGTYTVVIDKIGYKSDQFNVVIDDDNKLIDRAVTLVPAGTTKVDNNDLITTGISVYPNPSTDLVTINFIGTGNSAELKLFDAQGNTVYNSNISTNTGENIYSINTEKFSSGIYFVKVEMNNSGLFIPVIIAK